MTTTDWHLIEEGGNSTTQNDGLVVSSYFQTYRYETDSMTRPTPAAIAADIGISNGSPFVEDTNAICYDMDVKGDGITIPPYLKYLVGFKWATNATVPITFSTDPTTRRTLWSVRANTEQRWVTKYPVFASSSSSSSLAGVTSEQLIVNTAGQPPDGGIPVNVRIGQARATRNVAATSYNKSVVMAYSGAVNSVLYLGAPPGTLSVDVETEEKYEGGYHYWAEGWTFTYDARGVQPRFMSAGFFQRLGGSTPSSSSTSSSGCNPTLQRILNSHLTGISTDTAPVQEPEPLDASGLLVPICSRPSGCFEVVVPYHPTLDFNSFGL